MRVIYSDEDAPRCSFDGGSIFLAGPTPRDAETPSWRPEALKILEGLSFEGVVYVPERKIRTKDYDYDKQVQWEWDCLHHADVIVFWVPREISKMPAFTTNVEFGFYLAESQSPPSAHIVYGRPDWAVKTGYLDWMYKKVTGGNIHSTLEETLKAAVSFYY